jgi:hypothetical protein
VVVSQQAADLFRDIVARCPSGLNFSVPGTGVKYRLLPAYRTSEGYLLEKEVYDVAGTSTRWTTTIYQHEIEKIYDFLTEEL